MKIVILDGACAAQKDLNFDRFAELGEVEYFDRTPKDAVISRLQGARIAVTNKVPFDKAVFDACPELKFVTVLATGYNIIDCAYAREKGVVVSNVPAYSTDSVVQHTFALLLEYASRVSVHDEAVKNGEWSKNKDFCLLKADICELRGKTLGIIGYGSIGRKVRGVAEAFGMNVLFNTRTPVNGCSTLEEVLKKSDFITLHCPQTDKNFKMINKNSIALMKDGAVLINTARGGLIDEYDAAEALKSGKLAFFAADVLSSEPPKADNPLLLSPNTAITSHVAWASREARTRLIDAAYNNIRAFIDGKPVNAVNISEV
jgi:glycerate dehydrogenase